MPTESTEKQLHTIKYPHKTDVLTDELFVSEAMLSDNPDDAANVLKFKSIWDTGASSSVINKRVIDMLGLMPVGMVGALTASGSHRANIYLVNFYFEAVSFRVTFTGLKVTEGNLLGGVDVLIGMDVIGVGDFCITNMNNKTCLSFRVPSTKKIDFQVMETERIAEEKLKHKG